MNWQEFLGQQAKTKGLSTEEETTLLVAFPSPDESRSILKISQDNRIRIGDNAVKSRLQKIYRKFSDVVPELSEKDGAGKLDFLHNYLRQVYARSNQIENPIPEDYGYPKEFRSLIQSRIKRFVGRKFVFDRFERFVRENGKGYFTVIGEPGMGKSAIASKYVHEHHVPCYFNAVTNAAYSPETFLNSIRGQLIKRYGLKNVENESLLTVLEEVRDRLNPEQPLIILVDALDEVRQEPGPENILHLPKNLPDKVYFFLTRRPVADDTEKRLFTEIDTPQEILDLRLETEHNREDIKNCLRWYLSEDEEYRERLQIWLKENHCQAENFIELVASKVVDNFMYLVCLIDALLKEEYRHFDLNQLPPKLEEYYDLHWRRMGMDARENRFKVLVIYTIKEIQTPIPKEAIADILSIDLETVEEILNSWHQYFKIENIEGDFCYNFYHISFRKYIELRRELDKDKTMFHEVNDRIFQYTEEDTEEGNGETEEDTEEGNGEEE